jgi:hypothetical protein
VREVAGWVERELRGTVGTRAGIVWRGERQHFLRQNVNQPFDAFVVPVHIPDPGPDGTLNTPDDGMGIEGRQLRPDDLNVLPSNVVHNVPNSDSNYWTLDLTASNASMDAGPSSRDSRTPGTAIRPVHTSDSRFVRTRIR